MCSGMVYELSAYVRAWARHGVFLGLVSQEAAARSGLKDDDERELFGAARLEVPPFGAVAPARGVATDAVDLVVEDETLIYRFPYNVPDRAQRGERNPGFLHAQRFLDRIGPVLEVFGERTRLVVLRPAPLYGTEEIGFDEILERLDAFLLQLPPSCRYVLEPPSSLMLRRAYFDCLHVRKVVPLLSEGETLFRALPTVGEQLSLPGAVAPPCCVVRSEFREQVPGMSFHRWDGEGRRQGWYDAVRRCLTEQVPLYLFVDDDVDPVHSLMLLMEMLNEELAQRSVLRCDAA
jgi:hypothetical protein